MGSLFELSRVGKSYDAFTALADVSMTIEPGAVVGLVGANGAGKSTLLRLMAGLVRPSSGIVTFNGVSTSELPRRGSEIGVVLGARTCHPSSRVHMTLESVAVALGRSKAEGRRMVEAVGLGSSSRKRYAQLSLGMRQRVAIGCALLGEPRALLLDEPLNGLDPDGVAWMRALLREQADSGAVVVVSSHLLLELEAIADRVVGVRTGRIVIDSSVEGLRRSTERRHLVRTSNNALAHNSLSRWGMVCTPLPSGDLEVVGSWSAEQISELLFSQWLRVFRLEETRRSLEDLYMAALSGAGE